MKMIFRNSLVMALMGLAILAASCSQPKKPAADTATKRVVKEIKRTPPQKLSYHFEKSKQWLLTNKGIDSVKLHLVLAANRTDKDNLAKMDSIIVPDDLTGDIAYYLPFPLSVPALENINKIIFFSYPSQSFGAYENGQLVYTGPTNMGRKKDPTPPGIYYANWKAEKTISTVDDEWELKWNFNIQNKEGIGWHQYALPGYPASHSCLRLQEGDAHYLYYWANQWIVKGKDSVVANGTPVIVFGSYDFDGPKPWLQIVANPKALDIPAAILEQQVAPHINEIAAQQKKREEEEAATAAK